MRDPAMGEPKKRMTRMRYNAGPMGFISDQVQKEMQRAGYPVREHELYRSPERQSQLLARGRSTAKPFSSAHQFFGASDLIHEKWAWFDPAIPDVPDGAQFWATLYDCIQVVSERYSIPLRWGGDWNGNGVPVLHDPKESFWDPAHFELCNWRDFREVVGPRPPSRIALEWYFQQTLPAVWKQHLRSQERAA